MGGYIIYYSTFCGQCERLLQYISKNPIKSKIHFICIDTRKYDQDGNMFVMLDNGKSIYVPPDITRVPALIILTQNNRVVMGCENIVGFFQSLEFGGTSYGTASAAPPAAQTHAAAAAAAQHEPMPYVLNSAVGNGASGFGVTSDSFCFYDMSPDELKCDSTSSRRQLHNYVRVNDTIKIHTPDENYKPDKIGSVSLESLQQQRASECNIPNPML